MKRLLKRISHNTFIATKTFLQRLRIHNRKTRAITAAAVVVVAAVGGVLFVPTSTSTEKGETSKSNLVSRIMHENNEDKKTETTDHSSDSERKASKSTENVLESRLKQIARTEEQLKRDIENKRLTDDQAKQITAKLEEAKKFYAYIADKPQGERRDLVREKNRELREWAQKNDVRTSYLRLRTL